jgi:hypothetical protein
MILKSSVLWNVTPCGRVISQHFGGTYLLPIQCGKLKRARSIRKTGNMADFDGIHGIVSGKIVTTLNSVYERVDLLLGSSFSG